MNSTCQNLIAVIQSLSFNFDLTLLKDILIVIATSLAIITFFLKKKELFGNKLRELQLTYLANLRDQLFEASLDIHKIHFTVKSLVDRHIALAGYEEIDPENYKLYKKTQLLFKELYYKGKDPTSYIFPSDIDHSKFKALSDYLNNNKLAHFSVNALKDKEVTDIENLSIPILDLNKYIDLYLKKHL